MTWHAKTFHVGGGDNPMTSIRHYTYWHSSSLKDWFRFTKAKIEMPFETYETFTRGDESGHKAVLHYHPFYINDQDVIEWAFECVNKGFVAFDFIVDGSLENIAYGGNSKLTLKAKFSDKGMASLFKLAFR